ALLQRSGWEADGGERPAADSLCLVTPLGDNTTTAALAEGLDPRRVAAVDMLFGLDGRRSLMLSPATAPDFADSAAALLTSDGIPVSRLRDSTGFVGQRVVATIVNVACDMAQARIAAPAEIDVAVRLGLAYPQGPLAWGDAIGPGTL